MASFEIAWEAVGFIRFHAERMSVSGTSREEYKVSRDSSGRYSGQRIIRLCNIGRLTGDLPPPVSVCIIYFFVFCLVCRTHIPIETIFEPW